MQTTTTTKGAPISYYLAAIGVVGTLALVVMVLAANGIGNIGSGTREAAAPVSNAQQAVTSDALFALEAAHDMTRVRGAVGPVVSSDTLFAFEAAHDASRIHDARFRVVSSDAAYALEAEQVARQQQAQTHRMFMSSDTLYALEAQSLGRTRQQIAPFITSDALFALEAASVQESTVLKIQRP